MTSRDQFAHCFPAVPISKQERYHDAMDAACVEFNINTMQRVAAFWGQVGHETAGLQFLEELGGPDYFKQYDGRKDLGNVQPGDGNRYHGRGILQLTGRANYLEAGNALRLPLIDTPSLAADILVACRIGGWFWQKKSLNLLADADRYVDITKRINGGMNGWQNRLDRWLRARQVLGLPAPPPQIA